MNPRRRSANQCAVEPMEQRVLLTQLVEIGDFAAFGLDTQGAHLGSSVAIDGDIAVLGAPAGVTSGIRGGLAAVFLRNDAGTPEDVSDDTWEFDTTLAPPVSQPGLRFGSAVTVSGETIAIGAPRGRGAAGPGQVHVYRRQNDGSWQHGAELQAPSHGRSFGSALELDGPLLVVGSPASGLARRAGGAVDVFSDGDEWSHEYRLVHPRAAAGDAFGTDVEILGTRIAVGSPFDDLQTVNDGSVALFDLVDAEWTFTELVGSPAPRLGGQFGAALGLSQNRLIVGAPHEEADALRAAGLAHHFEFVAGEATLVETLSAEQPQARDRFGSAIAIDENLALVGRPGTGPGGVAAFELGGRGRLPAVDTDSRAGDRSGTAVAIDGTMAIVGAPSFDVVAAETGSGKSLFFDGGNWLATPASRLKAPAVEGEFGSDYDAAGTAVDTDGNTLVVGIPGRDLHRRANVGQVVVYVRDDQGTPDNQDDDTWVREAALTPPEVRPGDHFGAAVAVVGDRIVVGAPRADNGRRNGGAVHVFERQSGEWSRTQFIVPTRNRDGDQFGFSLDLDGDLLVVGAPLATAEWQRDAGRVYMFALEPDGWDPAGVIESPVPQVDGQFGYSVDLHGEMLAVGAPHQRVHAADAGMVAVFAKSTDTWLPAGTLSLPAGAHGDAFGYAVTLQGDELAVGAPGADSVQRDSGAAYTFARRETDWALTQTLQGAPQRDGRFGTSLEMRGDELLIGAPGRRQAQLFETGADGFEAAQIFAGSGNDFGHAVALHGGTVVAGAPGETLSAVRSGAAHVFQRVSDPKITVSDATVTEDARAVRFTVSRSHTRGDVKVHVETADGTAAAGMDFVGLPRQVLELPDGRSFVRVRVPLHADQLVESDETFELKLLDGVFAEIVDGSATGTIVDNDEPAFTVSETDDSTEAAESGVSDELIVSLPVQPPGDVVIGVRAENSEVRLTPAQIRFTPENWATPQTVQVEASDDDRDDGDLASGATFSVITAQSDPSFAELPDQHVTIQTVDNDRAQILLSHTESSTIVSEAGSTDIVDVRLATEPIGRVVLTLRSSDLTEAIVEPEQIEFTPENWSIPQPVRVRGVDDPRIDGLQTLQFIAEPHTSTSAPEFQAAAAESLDVYNSDVEFDFGFADRDRYPTTLADDGARHRISSDLRLGDAINSEEDSSRNRREANDGVTVPAEFVPGMEMSLPVESSGAGFVNAWLDLNRDGDWSDFGEQVIVDAPVEPGSNALTVKMPVHPGGGFTFLRVRLNSTGGLSESGLAADGEVEDYRVSIAARPQAVDDEFSVDNGVHDFDVLVNDLSTDAFFLHRVGVTENAQVSVSGDSVRFNADDTYTGDVEFTYVARGREVAVGSDRIRADDEFGSDVAIDGDFGVVGLPGLRNGTGAADVYRRTATGWRFEKRLAATSRAEGDRFGQTVAIMDGLIAVGAPNRGAGSVSAFEYRDGRWGDATEILPSGEVEGSAFGAALSIEGHRLVVGAPRAVTDDSPSGAAFVFDRASDDVWNPTARLVGSHTNGRDLFGNSVAIAGGRVVIGAPKDDIRGSSSGAAYVFEQNAVGNWVQRQRLAPKQLDPGDVFGHAVAVDGATIAVSAPLDDSNRTNSGAVWMFDFDESVNAFRTHSRVIPDKPLTRTRFGESIDLEGDSLVVGSLADTAAPILFQRQGADWKQMRSFSSPGSAVAISHGMVLFGQSDSGLFANIGGAVFGVDIREYTGRVQVHVS